MENDENTEKNEESTTLKNFYDFSRSKLVRVEYPGNVKNIDNAIKTLGGLPNIKEAVVEKRYPLELRFHPRNLYNKHCVSDKDENVGFLLKVKKNKENCETDPYSYEVLGAVRLNFEFNKMCDFQYLPLKEKKTENGETTAQFIHDDIFIRQVPTFEWFRSKETQELPVFSVPPTFLRYDTPHPQPGLKSGELFASFVRPDCHTNWSKKHQHPAVIKKKPAAYTHLLNLSKPSELSKIPMEPHPEALQRIKESKVFEMHYDIILRLLDDRPIWIRQGIMHMTKLKSDQVKAVLPALCYYCVSGPWKRCWIKIGYNPTKDPNSRLHQVIDFRIRNDGTQSSIIKSKRKSMLRNRSTYTRAHLAFGERGYMLKPGFLPPARQMTYQYCDILLPEVQEMIAKLPKLSQTAQYDIKNGWLPLSFTEQCREIILAYVKSTIHEELLNEAQKKRTGQGFFLEGNENDKEPNESVIASCSRQLSNISRGVYQRPRFDSLTMKGSKSVIELDDSTRGDAPSDIEEFFGENIEDSLSENDNMSENSDSDSDVAIIDLEAVEEINELIGNM